MSEVGEQVIEALQDAAAFAQGQTQGRRVHKIAVPEQVDVRVIRQRLRMSQRKFAETFGFSIHSIRNWEQGKRQPEGSARVLLTVIAKAVLANGCHAGQATPPHRQPAKAAAR